VLTAKNALAGDINGLAEQLLAENRVDDAVALFNLASREEPNNGQYANNLAIARFQAGDVAGAVGDLERALRTEGDRRLFTLNFADLALTRPRLLRRGLAVCADYLAANGDDAEAAAVAASASPCNARTAASPCGSSRSTRTAMATTGRRWTSRRTSQKHPGTEPRGETKALLETARSGRWVGVFRITGIRAFEG
jgi:tetratricopeptide (TPR) repeat protein